MSDFEFAVLYVENLAASKKFYAEILGRPPMELSPTFASFIPSSGLKLELWELAKVQPPSDARPGGSEICMSVPDEGSLRRMVEKWKARGVVIAQEPTAMVFGLSCVILDPDGHRLRFTVPR
jgi:catechol 2,3-dioxygenase-like lactoylglutathione lyase family enzyme